MALDLVLGADGRLEIGFFLVAPLPAAALDTVALDGGQHAGGLVAAHHADAGVGPHPEQARRVGAATHAVVAGAERAADDHRELRDGSTGHRGDHLGAGARDALVFVLSPDHEAGDVLQKDQRDLALAAQFDEVRALVGRLGEQDALVGDDAHRHALDMREAADQRGAVAGLELVKHAVVNDAGDDLAHVVGLAGIGRYHAVQLFDRIPGRLGRLQQQRLRLDAVQSSDGLPGQRQRVQIVLGQVVGNARQAGVHIATAQVLGADHFASGRLDQRRAAEKDRALVLDDDGLIAHRRHISAACGARAHHDRDLRDTGTRQMGLVVEDATEVVAVREHLVLVGQVGAA